MLPSRFDGHTESGKSFRSRSSQIAIVSTLINNLPSLEISVVTPEIISHLTMPIVNKLCFAAIKVCAHAFIPVSNFPVGAAILDEKDQIISGANVEHSIIGLG